MGKANWVSATRSEKESVFIRSTFFSAGLYFRSVVLSFYRSIVVLISDFSFAHASHSVQILSSPKLSTYRRTHIERRIWQECRCCVFFFFLHSLLLFCCSSATVWKSVSVSMYLVMIVSIWFGLYEYVISRRKYVCVCACAKAQRKANV